MQVSSSGYLPSGVPKINPDIGHFIPRDQLNWAYKKIDKKTEQIILEKHGVTVEDFSNMPEDKHEQISREYHEKVLELTNIFHEQLRKQLGI